jgi:predicted phage tail protein
MDISISSPAAEELERETCAIEASVAAITIDSPEMYEIAGSELKDVKAKLKLYDDRRKQITKPLDDAKKSVMALFSPFVERMERAERDIKNAMSIYWNAEEKKRLLAQAEADRLAREERERAEKEAKALEKAGKTEEAQATRAIAETTMAPTVVTEAPKVAGVAMAKTWVGSVADIKSMLHYIADHEELHGLVEFRQRALNDLARTYQGSGNVPGFKGEQVSGVRA